MNKNMALITGASGGIGEAFARLLASEGYDLILAARSANRLEALAEELRAAHGIEARAIRTDLSKAGAALDLVREIRESSQPVSLLVNNAGFGAFGEFRSMDPERIRDMIQVNITALTELTRALLPDLLQRGSAGILNVASTAAFLPGPLMAVYFATKAYVLSFGEALREELRGTGVTVTTLCPGPTASGFQEAAGMAESGLVRGRRLMSAEKAAAAGYRGLIRGRSLVIPGIANRIQAFSPRLAPRNVLPSIVMAMQKPANKPLT